MKARTAVIAIIGVVFFQSHALALAPIGPPRALLGENQWGIGFDLAYQNMDLSSSGIYFEQQFGGLQSQNAPMKIKDLESFPVLGRVDYGLTDNWDIFVCFGGVNAKDKILVENSPSAGAQFFNSGESFTLNSSHELAWGFGTRATLVENDYVSWGASLRVVMQDPKKSTDQWVDPADASRVINAEFDLDFWEISLGRGPTFNLGDYMIYGGPMLHILRGHLDLSGTWKDGGLTGSIRSSQDLEEETMVGGYIGGQWNACENIIWYLDGQFTSNAWGIGLGGIWTVE